MAVASREFPGLVARSVTAFSAVSGSQWIEVSLNGGDRVRATRPAPGCCRLFRRLGTGAWSVARRSRLDYDGLRPSPLSSERVWRQRLGANRQRDRLARSGSMASTTR